MVWSKRLALAGLAIATASHNQSTASSFVIHTTPSTRIRSSDRKTYSPRDVRTAIASSPSPDNDCGCDTAAVATTTIAGSPSDRARLLNPREALSQSVVYRLGSDGETEKLLDLAGNGVSLVVFTRSFGCPFCQEQSLQFSKKRDALLEAGVTLVIVSIGKPEVGKQMCEHLEIENGGEFIFADPENEAYNLLDLNSGWDTMIRPATAFRFRDRIFGQSGSLNELFEVLGKWKDAIYIPPNPEQATNHGGTFIFDGENTVFAHYDESPGTHADPNEAVDRAIRVANESRNTMVNA